MEYLRYEVYLVNLNPTVGSEIKKTRPCVIISPNEMNKNISTIIIVPLTSTKRNYPTRVNCRIQGKHGQIVLDQIRTVDKRRLVKKIDTVNKRIQIKLHEVLNEIFAE
ncbi:Death on curing protein, Doc toxin [hydrothermal vent metagenome]|uniref:Death on curing protein, Doc toxin n=1 Tax=hydrothermal vent metagenome TaxID=652676 RepID=A0A3B1CAH6_9ZZZZ